MTDSLDDHPIDDDYIDVETRRAEVETASVDESTRGSDESEATEIDRDSVTRQHADTDMSFMLHSGAGSGASSWRSAKIDEKGVESNDGRSRTRTTFYASEASDKRQQQYKRLAKYNDGVGSPDRDTRNNQADQRRAVETFCGHLDMTEFQRERAKHVTDELNMSHMAHFSSPQVILGVISLVANEDGRFIRDEEAFQSLMRDVTVTMSDMKTIRQLVRRKANTL